MERIDDIVRVVLDELREWTQGPDADALLGAATEMRRRSAWRQYACAALPGMIAMAQANNYSDALIVEGAVLYANAMLAAERERFDAKETP